MADLDPSMRIVVLHGKEPFLINEASRRYTDLLREAYGDVARFDFDGETAEIADVLDELRSLALFEPHKLVVVDAADKFLAEANADEDVPKPKKRQLSCRRLLEAYAEKPVEQASLPSMLDLLPEVGGMATQGLHEDLRSVNAEFEERVVRHMAQSIQGTRESLASTWPELGNEKRESIPVLARGRLG